MNSYPCEVIRDLLPLYYDEVCSTESGRAVLSHLAKCEECRKEYEKLCDSREIETAYDEEDNERITDSFKQVKRRNGKRSLLIALGAVLAVSAAAAAVLTYCLKPIYPEQKKQVASPDVLSAELKDEKLLFPQLKPLVYQKEEPECFITLDGDSRFAKPAGWLVSGSFEEWGAEVDWTFECVEDHYEELDKKVFSNEGAGNEIQSYRYAEPNGIEVFNGYDAKQNLGCKKYVYHDVFVYTFDDYAVNTQNNMVRIDVGDSAISWSSIYIVPDVKGDSDTEYSETSIELVKKDADKLEYQFNYNGSYYVFEAVIDAPDADDMQMQKLTDSVGRQMRTAIFYMIP